MSVSHQQRQSPLLKGVAVLALATSAVWAYYPAVRGLIHTWDTDPNYSQGFLIPLLAVSLLLGRVWEKRPPMEPSPRWGLGLLVAATALRATGAYFFVTPLDHASLLVALFGLVFLFGGWPWVGRAWPALGLLAFAFPIPSSLGGAAVTETLQSVATRASTFALQTLGVVSARDGNVILLKGAELGILEACSGLRMLMVFCALAVVTAALIPAGLARKVILVASAVPLALVCNVIRITVAGLASESLGTETGHFVFHDLAGWLMIPLAFLLLGVELFLLSKLLRPVTPAASGAFAAPAASARPPKPVVV